MSYQYQIWTKHNFVHEVILEDILHQGPSRHRHHHQQQQHPTTIVVCSTKEEFLNQLAACIERADAAVEADERHELLRGHNRIDRDEIPASQEDPDADELFTGQVDDADDDAVTMLSQEKHRSPNPSTKDQLLTPTLHLLSTSRNVKLVFCPTITMFRAYISVYVTSSMSSTSASRLEIGGKEKERVEDNPATGHRTTAATATMSTTKNSSLPNLLVLNLLQLHHGTSEFTLQGLSHTLATTVSAALRNDMTLVLVECQNVLDPTNPNRGSKLWDASVPLLSGSVKLKAAGAGWVGQTIPIRKIASRWFEFV